MKRVYIIHPFQGKEENRKRIDQICRTVANMGYLPVSPVHAFGFLKDEVPEERELALRLCQELIKGCDQVWLFGNWERSEGCNIEIQAAEETGVPVVDVGLLLAKLNLDKPRKRQKKRTPAEAGAITPNFIYHKGRGCQDETKKSNLPAYRS